MRQLVVAPTSLMHSTTAEQLKELAAFARANHLRMHSHLLEVGFDEQQAQKLHGMSAVNYAEQCHWLGEDVWFAHLVKATASDIQTLASTKTGIAHCPTSNLRLGSGIAPIIDMQKAGMPISIGVDGSASSESASMLQELNLAWLIHRAVHGADATQLAQVIQWGTQGGAEILGYKNLGTLDINQLADIVLYKTDDPRYCGVHEARLAPVMLGEPANVEYSFINGELVVQQGLVKGLDKDSLIEDVIRGMKIWKDKS
jgi:cytosine/adenosine deaminase-related metal-dependent hydrolase